MSSRLSGAILALAAATLLAVSIAGSGWWAGHPVSPTRTYNQIAHVGLHGAQLCLVDQAGLETCKDAPTHSVFGPVGYAELVAGILLVISSAGLGLLTLRRSDDRKTFALLAIGGALLGDLLAFALIAIGPTSEAAIPYGYGLYLFFTGSTLAIAGAVLARRPIAPRPVVTPLPAYQAPVPMPPSQQQPVIDMAALMRDDPQRPSSPEPMLGSRPVGAQPPSPGGVLPGLAGPLGAPGESNPPLFQSAPQLRPLYEMQGNTPIAPPPKFPPRAPTPLPREKIAIAIGQQTPPAPTPVAAKPKQTTMPPPFARAPVAPTAKPITVPPPVAKPSTGGSKPLPKVSSGPTSARMPAVVPIPAIIPTPPPLEPPTSTTDPGGYAAVADTGVGDSTDVNVPIQTPPPQADATSPNLEPAPPTSEEPALPRAETNDDLETIAREKVSLTEIEVKPAEPKVPISTAPESLPPPVQKRAASSGPSPACPQCEAPMAWVEEHLRFYCKSCRMYF